MNRRELIGRVSTALAALALPVKWLFRRQAVWPMPEIGCLVRASTPREAINSAPAAGTQFCDVVVGRVVATPVSPGLWRVSYTLIPKPKPMLGEFI